jgi:hypothetical protein
MEETAMMDQTGSYRFEYKDVMRALGYFIDQNNLREICIVELNEGILIRGSSHTASRTGFLANTESYLFSNEDLERIINETYERRGLPKRSSTDYGPANSANATDNLNRGVIQPLPQTEQSGQQQPSPRTLPLS